MYIYLFINISRQYLYMCRSWLVSSYAVHYRSSSTISDGLWRAIKAPQSPYRLHTDRTHSGKYIIFSPTATKTHAEYNIQTTNT